jgi:hypothetical protein
MNLQQINKRVQTEADARIGETIEHLLFLLDYEYRTKTVVRRCYCDLINKGGSASEFFEMEDCCENCRDS